MGFLLFFFKKTKNSQVEKLNLQFLKTIRPDRPNNNAVIHVML